MFFRIVTISQGFPPSSGNGVDTLGKNINNLWHSSWRRRGDAKRLLKVQGFALVVVLEPAYFSDHESPKSSEISEMRIMRARDSREPRPKDLGPRTWDLGPRT